ncbi:DNA polymerase III subunit alpha [Chryseobacterium indologenes]|uniref:DNA-directed DNA polymerase n=6 Tax=Chryseobacterium TaxID=59732 RepID=A0A3G6RPI3_CHRLC|nr:MULTISPECIES: DNA polymerase III subunit alpha [Bacteroidota]AZA84559.1 DNA polymerase III subunit alpha [Chryseobacterium lactis]AZB04947.1 DNA polymerase III subunit alpha [Chryseobacterium lactis]KMQ64424.1 DNA polymerase III subunit alpha [Chryseobacterium angstadtii]MBF6643632.1 DNA polymerase III subunit alpha [Chryseobacterium indologenes]PNW14678.1 DNA polymerase III subunit alpha [Chryseobacterium lactis]
MLLNLHSYYSLRYGTISVKDLIEGIRKYGFDTAVLTDMNNSSATIDFIRQCREAGINGLAGMEFRNNCKLLYIGIAKNEKGFRELNEFMTAHNRDKTLLPPIAPGFRDVFIIYPYGSIQEAALRDNEFIGIRPSELTRYIVAPKRFMDRYVILSPVSFKQDDFQLHKQLRAIDNNILISQLPADQMAEKDEIFVHKEKLMQIYGLVPELIANTEKLLSECRFDFDFKGSKNKKTFTGNRYDDKQLLFKYAMDGFERRYGSNDKIARDRVLHELDIIHELNFSSYFLITDDICRYARNRNFHYVGRGSGANSIIAYCLGITDVCPIELNLYFERFLNPKRKSPPDFDVDFSWRDRDEIYDYIFKRYQGEHTALMGAMGTFRDRSIIRELGKVYGLPKPEIDRLISDPSNMLNKNEVTRTILGVYNQMADFPNQRTIHASGVLISENPLTCYSALDYPPKNLPTMQFDMYVAEEIGFEKFDILSQRGIGHIEDCREIVRTNRGEAIETSDPKRFFNDPKIADQLRSAHTVGCFYIESPAMRQLISKLKCDDYLTLVAASSIIRPGVASSGMMGTFIERHLNPEKVEYIHPAFKQELEDTYGVMVYQEDVMKIGHRFGGLDLADADVLRRMMSGKYRNKNHMLEIEDKFFSHCRNQNYPEEISREVWRQMESFAGYSFNKAHSASFAVESYQSLFLKTYYPLEFMVAVLNNHGGFYDREVYVNEAKKAGANICLPCINRSIFDTSIIGKDIYLGFDCILNLETKLAQSISEERKKNGPYLGIEDFNQRTGAGLEQIIILIRCGAFGFLDVDKKELLWEAHLILNSNKNMNFQLGQLFQSSNEKPKLPVLITDPLEDIYDEIELMGFPVSGSIFDLAKSNYRGNACADNMSLFAGQTVRIVAYMVAEKWVKTKTGKPMKFGTFLDNNGDFIDTVHFTQSLLKFPLRGKGLYLIEGRVTIEYGCPSIDVQRCAKMPIRPDPRSI